jgi:hypothetical protein
MEKQNEIAPQLYFYEKSIVISSNVTYSVCSFPIGFFGFFPIFNINLYFAEF